MSLASNTVLSNKRGKIDRNSVSFSEYNGRPVDKCQNKKLSKVYMAAIHRTTRQNSSSLSLNAEYYNSNKSLKENCNSFSLQNSKSFSDCRKQLSLNRTSSESLKSNREIEKKVPSNNELPKKDLNRYIHSSITKYNSKTKNHVVPTHKCKSIDSSDRNTLKGKSVESDLGLCNNKWLSNSNSQIKPHPLSQSLGNSSQRLKRSVSQSPNRNFNKGNYQYDTENTKTKLGKGESSLYQNQIKDESQKNLSSSEKRVLKRVRLWKFDENAMWVLNSNGDKRVGYLLFKCSIVDEVKQQSIAEKYEMTYKFSQADSKLIRILMNAHGLKEVNLSSTVFNLYWGNSHFSPHDIRSLQDWQKINHFPRSSELTRKDRLYMNIKRMQRQCGVKAFDFIPLSFILPTEYRDFCDTHLRERGTWIVKPVASSQGKGIYLASQVDQVPSDETALICRYLESPLLINGYKCDLRLYVLLTSLDPLVVYMYEEGLVRFATVKYQHGKNLWNPCIHLTNYSVNKFHSNYIQNEDPEQDNKGNKWSLSAFLRYLKSNGVDTRVLMCNIEDVIIKSILSAAYQMNTATNMFIPHPRNCFELYGFDILVDSDFKPWVLEVNLSPSLNVDQPLDLKIKSAMLADLFSLVGIQIFNPKKTKVSNRPPVYRKLPNLRQSSYTFDSFKPQNRSSGANTTGFLSPTSEELSLFRQLEEEFERKGGWARIFPTPDSWALYGSLQEYSSPLNLIFHLHLYPHMPRSNRFHRVSPLKITNASSSGLASSLERLNCYERSLPKVYSYLQEKFGWGDKSKDKITMDLHTIEVKDILVSALKNGLTLSKYHARMTFSAYLQLIQRRLMIGIDQDKHTDLVCRFLRSASRTLQSPFSIQAPSKSLPDGARAVIIAKQLGDFIQAYTRDTQSLLDSRTSHSTFSFSTQSSLPLFTDNHSTSLSSVSFDSTRPESAAIPESSFIPQDGAINSSIFSCDDGKLFCSPSDNSSFFLDDSSQSDLDISLPIPSCLQPTKSSAYSQSPLIDSSTTSDSNVSSFSSVGLKPFSGSGFNQSSEENLIDLPDRDNISKDLVVSSEAKDRPEDVVKLRNHKKISVELYRTFLSNARESELEEILNLQTKNSAAVFLDPSPHRSQPSNSSESAHTRCRTPTLSCRGSPRKSSNKNLVSSSLNSSNLDLHSSNVPSTCCLFSDILKASFKGTKIPY